MPKNIKTKKEETGEAKEKNTVKEKSALKSAVRKTAKDVKKDKAHADAKVVFMKKKIKPVAQEKTAREKFVPVVQEKTSVDVQKEILGDSQEKHFAKWVAKDFVRSREDVLFYWGSAAAAILVILWSIKDGNWISFVTFVTLLVVIAFELKSVPRDVEYKIDIDGISIDGRLYKFEDIRSFEIVQKEDLNVLKLQLKSSLFPVKELFLDPSQNLAFMQALMEYFLPQEKQEETLFNFNTKRELTEEEFIDKQVNDYLKGKGKNL